MKPLLLAAALALTATVSAFAENYPFKEPISATHPLRSGGTLSVDNVNGDVEVRTWDRAEVRIEGEKSARTDEELKLVQLTIEPTAERVVIRVKLPKRSGGWFGRSDIRASVRFTITVPADAKLDEVETVNGGVTIDGVHGSINAGSVNGRVKAHGLTGEAKLTTTNGGVEAHVVSLPATGKLELHSVNGGVTLTLPKDIGATLNASTVNGGVDCDFPLTMKGRVSGSKLRGTIGAGGPEINVSTVNGGVHIRDH